jgi:endonuclease I
MKKITSIILLSLFASTYTLADVGDLLISEVVVTPTNAEFIEIYNSGATAVDLSNVYLTDATFIGGGGTYYWQIVNGSGAGGGGGFNDFHARFPDTAMIAAGAYQTISITGSTNFLNVYGFNPTYELYEDAITADSVDDMREAFTDSIASPTNTIAAEKCAFGNPCPSELSSGEVAILYSWNGSTDLVQDLDYVVWGDKNEAVTKTGEMINTSSYLDDTSIANQVVISTDPHAGGMSWQRDESLNEGTEVQTGGNGINSSDETSENLNITFYEATPSPNAAGTPPPPPAPDIIINEVDAIGTADFVEIKGPVGTSLNDVTLVLFQGSDDTIYRIRDLSGSVIANEGYFLVNNIKGVGDASLGGSINDDASAVAIYFKNESNFTIGDSINDVDFVNDIIDAMVYHDGTPDDGGLLALLNASEPQVNEGANAAMNIESNARCADGKGGKLNTTSYMQVTPTPGGINSTCPVIPYYINADPTTPVTLRTTLHDIIKGHTSFPYSASTTDTWDVLGFADEDHNASVDLDPNIAERVWMLYRNNSFVKVLNFGNEYNREHTWPQSKGFSSPDNNAPRTDAHHLMISDVGYNGTRGNKYFDNCNPALDNSCNPLQTASYDGDGDGNNEGGDTGSTYPGNANWTNNSIFEVWNFRKGDVARAMFYMDIRYEGMGEVDSTGTSEPDLTLVEVPGSGPEMGRLSTLLQWHKDDPVDDIELERNEVVFSYQGNRNPFIDHPEWVACIFENDCPPADILFKNGFED